VTVLVEEPALLVAVKV
jgi:hypothetical protein